MDIDEIAKEVFRYFSMLFLIFVFGRILLAYIETRNEGKRD